jgi:membrane-bound serine protease (ClpP class)
MNRKKLLKFWLFLYSFVVLVMGNISGGMSAESSSQVLVLTSSGAVTPAMQQYLQRGIDTAESKGVDLIVFQLDTPGGSVELMNSMVQDIRASKVPIVVYVWPRGAIAGSAGTVITLAGHVAAMAPETAIGAASPVGSEGEDLGETMEAKTKNILKATVRSLAERRGDEAVKIAEDTIETARAVSAQEALDAGLIDFIASDVQDLLRQMNGFSVVMDGGSLLLQTEYAIVTEFPASFIEQLLSTLTNPNIVFILLTIGVQAILIELSSPGGWVAGFIGVVCVALATYGIGVLPVNGFGLIFLATSFALFILDIKAPTHGALTAAGVVTLIIGALVLFNSPSVPAFQRVSVPLIIGMSILTGGLFFSILLFAIRAQRAPIRTGQESLAGRKGITRTEISPNGTAQVGGELWSASLDEGEPPIPAATRIKVTRVEGIHLTIRRDS